VKWSALVAAAMLIGIVIYDYAIGAKDFSSPEAAQAATAQDLREKYPAIAAATD
jgi:hypothetical protein